MVKGQLPLSYQEVDAVDGDEAFAAIIVDPRSSGILYVPGQYSSESPLPAYRKEVFATDERGVDVEEVRRGSEARFVVTVNVQNRRDSHSVVKLYWTPLPSA